MPDLGIPAVEPADVGRPPRDTRQAHIQARRQLVPQGIKAGMDVAAPDERAVLLRACPGAAQQVENILLPRRLLAFIKGLGVAHGIYVSDLHVRPKIIPVVVEIIVACIPAPLRPARRFVPLVEIILLRLFPQIFALPGFVAS